MKKLMKLLSLVLVLALVLSLAACSGKAASIVGKWSTTMDMDKLLESESAADKDDEEGMGALLEMFGGMFKGVSLKMNLELKEDGTYEMSSDEESVKAAAAAMKENMKTALPGILAGVYGCSEDELEAKLAENGSSLEEAMAQMGDMFDADSMAEEFGGDNNEKGTYTYEDGKLTLKSDDAEENDSMVWVVELSATELKVTDIEGQEDDGYKAMLPLVFTK